jgi:hypothetical protein
VCVGVLVCEQAHDDRVNRKCGVVWCGVVFVCACERDQTYGDCV